MNSTKTRHLYPNGSEFPSLLASGGKNPADGVPLRWLESLVKECLRRIPTEGERNSALVFGMEHLRVTYIDELTPEEQMRDELADLSRKLAAVQSLLPRQGETMTAEQVAALREALGR